MSIEPHDLDLARRDVLALELILKEQPELYVNIIGEPCVGLPLVAGTDRIPWLLRHDRVRAEITGYIWEKLRIVLYDHELNRILRVLESRAWCDQRINIEFKDAIEHDPLLEGMFIYLEDPNSKGGVNLTASELLNRLGKKARLSGVDTRHHAWPKGAAQLSRRIGEFVPLLKKAGISVERGRTTMGVRFINLFRDPPSADGDQTASQPPSIDKSHHPKRFLPTDTGDAVGEGIYESILPEERNRE